MTRTSVCQYQDQAVESDKIQTLLKAGMAAPSAMNAQPWHFVVVTDKEQLKAIAEATPNAGMAAEAPLAIVVCGDMSKVGKDANKDFWIQDVSAASENILLAAHALGLGAVWTGTWPRQERSQKISDLLKLPDHFIPFNTIVIGYPAESPAVKDKFKAENISYNVFGGTNGSAVAVIPSTKEEGFKEFNVREDWRANGFNWLLGSGVILCAGDNQKSNAMTIGWGGIGTLWSKDAITVYVAQGRYTHEFMERSKYFTVMTFKDQKILQYMGSHSGRDGDKAKALGLHVAYTDNGTPYYEEADMVIEARIMYGRIFDEAAFKDDVPKKLYSNFPAGLHSEYIGEVVKAMKK